MALESSTINYTENLCRDLVHLYDEVTSNEDDNSVRDNHDNNNTLYCKNQYTAEGAEFDDYIERPSPIIDHNAERAAAHNNIAITTAALPTAGSAALILSLPNFALVLYWCCRTRTPSNLQLERSKDAISDD
ncbi:hypothetical protein Trihar35433_3207 [Trichoderma harzianum]|nr:hypothetical protein Trihar35433_3207 [Trichoderma harzianum]